MRDNTQFTEKEMDSIINDLKILSLTLTDLTFILEGARIGYYGGKEEET